MSRRPLMSAPKSVANTGNVGGAATTGMDADFDMEPPGEDINQPASKVNRQLSTGSTTTAAPKRAAAGSAISAVRAQQKKSSTFAFSANAPQPLSLSSAPRPPGTGDSTMLLAPGGGRDSSLSLTNPLASTLRSSSSRHFALTPNVAEFNGVQSGQIYFMVLNVQNISNKRRAIKLLPPATDQFSMEVSTVHTEVSPGLSLKIKVYFQCPQPPVRESTDSDDDFQQKLKAYANQSWHDRIVLLSGEDSNTERVHIPLHAWGKKSSLQFNSFIDFGTIQSNSNVTQLLSIKNIGEFPGSYRLEFDPQIPVIISPAQGTLDKAGTKGAQAQIKCELTTTELPLGPYRALGRLYIDENPTPQLLDLNANIVEASLQLIWPTVPLGAKASKTGVVESLQHLSAQQLEKCAEIYFGNLYFGEVKKIDALVLNNSPQSVNFLVNLSDMRDEKNNTSALLSSMESTRGGAGAPLDSARNEPRSIAGSVLGDHDLDHDDPNHPPAAAAVYKPDILVAPMEGRLEPYQSMKITFIFQPSQPKHLLKELNVGFKSHQQGDSGDRPEPPCVKYNALCKIDSLDGKYRTTVPVQGNANIPCVQVSKDLFDFGGAKVHEHVDQYLTIKNTSSELPLAFELERIAHFIATPAFGKLAPRESKRILVSFHPNNLGVFKNKIMNLKLLGAPSGKAPSMLKPTHTQASKPAVKNDAVVLVPLTLSGVSEAIGENRTLTLTTGGKNKLLEGFKKPLVLVKSNQELREEKELEALATGQAKIKQSKTAPNFDSSDEDDNAPPEESKESKLTASGSEDELDLVGRVEDLGFDDPEVQVPSNITDAAKRRKFKRTTGWNDPALASQYQGRYEVQKDSLDNRVTFTPAELQARTANQAYYKQFLSQSRKARDPKNQFHPSELEAIDPSQAELYQDKPIDAKGMGLSFAEGLTEPTIPLPAPADRLKLHYSMAGFEGEGRKRLLKKTNQLDAEKNKKPLKIAPSTRAEKRDCETFLQPAELQNIIRGPKLLEFGKLCLNASATRIFSVTNDLEQHVLVELKIRSVELSRTTPQSQMIPPGETANFPVVFSSETEQEFKRSVIYTINNQHDFNFIATAFVVPMELAINKEELNFEFKPDNGQFYVSEYVTLENVYNVPTEFYFATPSHLDCFVVNPSKGIVGPNSKLRVEVRYEPKYCNAANQLLTSEVVLNIVNGASKKIIVRASLNEASCAFTRGARALDFHTMCVGTPMTKVVTIKNDGTTRTVFRFDDIPPGVRVKPSQGKLETGTSMPINVTVYPTVDMKLKHHLTVAVRGKAKEAKPLKLLLKGEAVLPALSILEDEINFGGVTLGSNATRLVSLHNTGGVPATIFLDLSRCPEFSVSYADALGNEEVMDNGAIKNPIIQKISTSVIRRNGSTASVEAAELAAAREGTYRGDDEDQLGYSVFLAPHTVVAFNLHFNPTRVVDLAFELPITVSGIPSFSSLRRVVTASGLKPRISLSTMALDFGKRVLMKKGRASKNPYISKFLIKNEDSTPISWFLKGEDQAPSTPLSSFGASVSSRIPSRMGTASPSSPGGPEQELNWRMEPTSGTLPPGQDVTVMVYFSPTASQAYSYPVDIYLDGTAESLKEPAQIMEIQHEKTPSSSPVVNTNSPTPPKPYTSMVLSGYGTTPRLIFDTEQVILPTVPLNIKSTATFHIRNEGYENLELRYEISMDNTRAPISLRLPEGSTLGINHPIIPVEITLLAKKPVSFALNLHFFDNENNKFIIPVTGTSDNSVLTVQNYLETHPGGFDIAVTTPLLDQRGHHGVTGVSRDAVNKILTLHELSEANMRKLPEKARKAIYKDLEANSPMANRKGGFDFDEGEEGAAEEEADQFDAEIDFNSFGNGTANFSGGEERNRLTPLAMLAQSNLAGGDGLYTHTLESVLAYLNASNLLKEKRDDDEALSDSPPLSANLSATELGATAQSQSSVRSPRNANMHPSSSSKKISSNKDNGLSIASDTFPADLIKTQGKIVRTLVRNLSGKNVPTQASKKQMSFAERQKNATTISMQTTLTQPMQNAPGSANILTLDSSAGIKPSSSNLGSTFGSTMEFLPPNTSANKSDELIYTIYQDYEELLIFLKSQGCLLGFVQPWHLLSWNQLLRLLNSTTLNVNFNELGITAQMSPAEISARQRTLEKDFPALSRNGWLAILIQLIKVFVLNRITVNSFRNLPGMSSDSACMNYTYSQSNVYSVAESILLEWCNFHYNRSCPLQPRSVIDFQKSLSDGLVLIGVLQSHVPNLTSLTHLRTHILSTDDCMYNANKLLLALKELGLNYNITANQFVNAHARDMVLFVLFLFQKLPSFVPKTTLEFKGALAEDMVKCIELSNPSGRAITYAVHLEGSVDFTVDKYAVRLAPKGKQGSTVKFPVRFKARFSKPVEARLVFTSNDEGSSTASTLVFLLKSHVSSRTPTAVYQSNARVYENALVDIRVTNPFNSDCTFNIAVKLEQEPQIPGKKGGGANGGYDGSVAPSPRNGSNNANRLNSARSNASARSSSNVSSDRLPPPIFVPYERIKLRAGESASLHTSFLPLRVGSYRAHIIFLDELCGEFMIEVQGTASPPPPSELFKWTTHNKNSESKEVQISFKNAGIELARAATFERIRSLSRQQRDLKKNKSDWNFQILKTDTLPSGGAVSYTVTSTSPFFSVSPTTVLHDIKLEKDSAKKPSQPKGKSGIPLVVTDLTVVPGKHEKKESTAQSLTAAFFANKNHPDNKVNVLFAPRGAGVYRGEIVMTSLYDSRVYALEVNVLADETSPMLEYKVPARQTVVQDIPISNTSSDIWTIKSNINGKYFHGPPDVTVYPGTVAAYPLSFTPSWVCEIQGSLTLYNTKNDEKYAYDLLGIGDEPLAERHVIIEAPARSTVQHKLAVTNSANTDIYYTVDCDLPTFEGPTNFRIASGATTDYVFTLSPSISGTLLGSITFNQADKRFQWFSVEVKVRAPEAEQEIVISTACRKAATVSIAIANPLDEPLMMEVALEGLGLHGPKFLNLEANSTKEYEFIYSPLLPVENSEASVSFSSEAVGEFWYKLLLTATPPEVEHLDFGSVEVGMNRAIDVVLENPTDEEIALKCVSSNSRNFTAKPNAFVIPPLSSQPISLRYNPNSIGDTQKATLVFKHPLVGDWIFSATGIGMKPASMPLTTLTAPVGSRVSRTLAFRNPFGTKLKVDIDLVDSNDQGTPISMDTTSAPLAPFTLFMKRTQGLVLAPYSQMQLPFIFAPSVIADHTSSIKVAAKDLDLLWTFPLKGIAEGPSNESSIILHTAAREVISEARELKLQGLPALNGVERFSVAIESGEDVKALLDKALHVECMTPELTSSHHGVKIAFTLDPLIPFRAHAFVVVSKASGGRWKFPLSVTVDAPMPDDTLRIEAAVHSTSSVAFRLKNTHGHARPFKAGLSLDSSPTFHVWPRSGVLPADDSEEGTQFIVSFSPTEYGKPLHGSLHIETDEMFYCYALIGTHPLYAPPVVKSTLDNVNHAAIAASDSPRHPVNHITSNMKAAANAPVLAQKVSKVRAWKGASGNTSTAAIAASATGAFLPSKGK